MNTRLFFAPFLALCLVLTSIAGVVAETRMAVAGGYCGTGAPQILLDQAGLPLLDGDGAAIAAPDCSICHLSLALTSPPAPIFRAASLISTATAVAAPSFIPLSQDSNHHARAPPRLA